MSLFDWLRGKPQFGRFTDVDALLFAIGVSLCGDGLESAPLVTPCA